VRMKCKHNVPAELCPDCLRVEIERLRAQLDDGPAVTDLVQELRAEVERLTRRVSDLEKYPRDLT